MKEKSYGRKKANENLKYISSLLFVLVFIAIFIGLYISVVFGTRDAIMICSGIGIGTVFYFMVDNVLRKKFLPHWGRYKRSTQGAIGEEEVHNTLINKLGKGNLILYDTVLDGNTGNIDHIIIGEYGVFAIETKTHRGRIVCNGDDWDQYRKIGEKTVPFKIEPSPSIQARSNAGCLSSFLKQHYPKLSAVWVEAIVVFPNKLNEGYPIVREKDPSKCKVFDSIDSMIDEIKKEKALNITEQDLSNLENKFKPLATEIKKV